jgi:hypothetical protein
VVEQVTVWGVGPVSLITLDELHAAAHARRGRADLLAMGEAQAAADAEDRLADAGALLVPRRAWWPVPPELYPHIEEADRLVATISQLDGRPDGSSLQRRAEASAHLRAILLEVAYVGGHAGIGVPDVEPVLEAAAGLQEKARQLGIELQTEVAALQQLDREIQFREQAEQYLGFDALHLAAHIRANGLPVVQSPMSLGAGEVVHLTLDAALGQPVRMSAPAADAGPPVPTGIQNWIGTIRGGRAPVAGGRPLDTGVLVVTSRRLVFAGRAGAIAVQLDAMLAMDVYEDGLAVLQIGREAGDVFLVQDPGLVAFYANWVAERG